MTGKNRRASAGSSTKWVPSSRHCTACRVISFEPALKYVSCPFPVPLTLLPKSLLNGRSKFVRGFERSVVTYTGKRLKSNINEEFIEPV